MGKLFEYRMVIENKVKDMGQDAFKVKRQIGVTSGVLLGSIGANTPDDPEKIQALKSAIEELLGVTV